MTLLFAGSCLSRGDLTLKLSNELGYPKDASLVQWTIFSFNGERVSGAGLTAVKDSTGEYYAPWKVSEKNGNYKILWEFKENFGGPLLTKESFFFVVNPNSYFCPPDNLCEDGIPDPGGFTFLTGQILGKDDLFLNLKDENGIFVDADIVKWTIIDALGRAISPQSVASRADVGRYFAPFLVTAKTGNYSILWEFQATITSPATIVQQNFCVVFPSAPCAILVEVCGTAFRQAACTPCPPSSFTLCIAVPSVRELTKFVFASSAACAVSTTSCVPPQIIPSNPVTSEKCCPFEISRTVHLSEQVLPVSNGFTDQPTFLIPSGIRCVAFYVTYTRGSPGGHVVLRLFWSNGIEETQTTLIADSINQLSSARTNQEMFVNDFKGPVPDDSSPITFLLEVAPPGGAKSVRLLAAEGGTSTPGIVSITLTASS